MPKTAQRAEGAGSGRSRSIPALLAVLTGVIVLISWYAHGPLVTRAVPAPTANTGLAIVSCAAALLLAERRKWSPAVAVLASCAILLALTNTVQYLLPFDTGIDRLLIDPYAREGTRVPGRMSLMSAGCVILVAAAVMAWSRAGGSRRTASFSGLAGTLVAGMGCVAVVGYMARVPALTAWGGYRPMAWLTALGFICLGAGLLIRGWEASRESATTWPDWLPAAAGAMALLCTVSVWHAMSARQTTSEEQWRNVTAPSREKISMKDERDRAGDAWLPGLVLCMGLAFSGVLAVAVAETLRSRRRMVAIEAARQQLEIESSQRQRAVEQLRASEAERNTLIGNIPGAVYRCEVAAPWRSAYISTAVESFSGHTAEEFLANKITLGEIILPEDTEAVSRDVERAVAARRTYQLEYRVRHADGSIRWVQEEGRAAYDSEGQPRWLDGVIFDVTGHVRAELALKESEYWLAESQRISGIGTYVLNVDAGTWRSSEALDQIFGIGPEYPRTIEGWHALVLSEDREAFEEHFRAEALRGNKTLDREYRIVRPSDGKQRRVHARGAMLDGAGGTAATLAGTVQDITERSSMEEQLRQAQKMESVGRLAGGVAHDFNNLLTVINGFTELVLAGLPDDDTRRGSLQEVRKAGERATSLTRQLLAFSRRQVLQPQTLDLNALVRDVEQMLLRVIGEDVHLRTVLAPKLARLQADPGQLTQVLMNLVVNARDAMPSGGQITIETANVALGEDYAVTHPGLRPGAFVRLTVSDTGCGMDEQTQQQLFEPFFTTKGAGSGTGLGLSTVYGIVKQSGGSINVYSELGVGSSFKIYLPAIEALETVDVATVEAAGPDATAGTILVVEDQESVRHLTVAMLEQLGYHVLQASCGKEALEVAGSFGGTIDLVLTDVVMPGLTGKQVADFLSASRPGIRFLYMSGYTNNVIVHHGILDHDVLLLEKPFRLEQLSQKVRQALAGGSDRAARGSSTPANQAAVHD